MVFFVSSDIFLVDFFCNSDVCLVSCCFVIQAGAVLFVLFVHFACLLETRTAVCLPFLKLECRKQVLSDWSTKKRSVTIRGKRRTNFSQVWSWTTNRALKIKMDQNAFTQIHTVHDFNIQIEAANEKTLLSLMVSNASWAQYHQKAKLSCEFNMGRLQLLTMFLSNKPALLSVLWVLPVPSVLCCQNWCSGFMTCHHSSSRLFWSRINHRPASFSIGHAWRGKNWSLQVSYFSNDTTKHIQALDSGFQPLATKGVRWEFPRWLGWGLPLHPGALSDMLW